MNTIKTILKSRTVWTALAMFIVAGTHGIEGLIPASSVPYVEAFLTFLVGYFHINPSQQYGG